MDPNEINALWVQFQALPTDAAAARRELAQRAITAHPDQSIAWLLLAFAESGEARHAALQHAGKLEPAQPGVLTLLAEELVSSGRAREALRYKNVALRRDVACRGASGLRSERWTGDGRT